MRPLLDKPLHYYNIICEQMAKSAFAIQLRQGYVGQEATADCPLTDC
jgi:hypothetical protein